MVSGASGAANPESQPPRRSTSRKQLHFAPLQLGLIPEQPHGKPLKGSGDELFSPGRSKSLGSAVDRALLQEAVQAELAVTKERPHSAQFSRKVRALALRKRKVLCATLYSCV